MFCAALLNAQPMGFYAPAQIVRDARDHGVEVRPVCVNACAGTARWSRRPGRMLAVRLGLRMAKGLSNEDSARIVAHRADMPFRGIEELWRRAGVPAAALETLAEADAFRGLGLDRRQALWAIRGLADAALPLFAAADRGRQPQPELVEPPVALAPMTEGGEVVEDYRSVGLTLRRHPVAFLRHELAGRQHDHLRRPARAPGTATASSCRASCWSGSGPAAPGASCSSPSRTKPASPI